jgi:heterokaryon incompatibility protein (HET)
MANSDQYTMLQTPSQATSDSNLYSTLPTVDHIRVFEVLPGTGDEQLHCHLKVSTVAESENLYDALSYVWGDSAVTEPIICNESSFPVTTSLANALRHIRQPERARLLWADAICINQDDKLEKGHQVKKMSAIYEAAKQVLVWLGSDTDGIAEDVFALIRETNKVLFDLLCKRIKWELDPKFGICVDKSRWSKVFKLLALPWFQRVWVIQESGLGKDCLLMWGLHSMRMADLVELEFWRSTKRDFDELIGRSMVRLLDVFLTIQCTYSNTITWRKSTMLLQLLSQKLAPFTVYFSDILNGGRAVSASDKRDHVYAFLGAPQARKPNGDLLIEPDYQKSVEDVYFETASALIRHPREAPWVLANVKHASQEDIDDDNLPSWVPRWDRGIMFYHLGQPQCWYRAGGADISFEPEIRPNRSLAVVGFSFDEVIWTSQIIRRENLSLNSSLWDAEFRDSGVPLIEMLISELCTVTGRSEEQLEHDINLALVIGYMTDKDKLNATTVNLANFKAYRYMIRKAANPKNEHGPSQSESSDGQGDAHAFCLSDELSHLRSLFYTKNGRLGIGHRFSRKGDVVYVFPGLSVPFVLRKYPDGNYKLIGDCYINGVMEGELMEGLKTGAVRNETMILV